MRSISKGYLNLGKYFVTINTVVYLTYWITIGNNISSTLEANSINNVLIPFHHLGSYLSVPSYGEITEIISMIHREHREV